MTYWDDLEKQEVRKHKRDVEWLELKHNHKMEELDKEVTLFKLKKKKEKGDE